MPDLALTRIIGKTTNCGVDLNCPFSHKLRYIFNEGVGFRPVMQSSQHLFTEETTSMDTKALDKQGKEHLQFYKNFMFATKISIAVIVASLVIMAVTLV